MTHGQSSMKIGVDAVLIGAWAGEKASRILDVGTGSGVISLLLAQRFPKANIEGIDIDVLSIEEAQENFNHSPWHDRLEARLRIYPEDMLEEKEKYDLIVSNPPYFSSGIERPETRREIARHQGTLSIFSLIENSHQLLTENGVVSAIFPAEFEDKAVKTANDNELYVRRRCLIRDNSSRPVKRIMMEFSKKNEGSGEIEHLTLFEDGEPTQSYKELCREFYLKF